MEDSDSKKGPAKNEEGGNKKTASKSLVVMAPPPIPPEQRNGRTKEDGGKKEPRIEVSQIGSGHFLPRYVDLVVLSSRAFVELAGRLSAQHRARECRSAAYCSIGWLKPGGREDKGIAKRVHLKRGTSRGHLKRELTSQHYSHETKVSRSSTPRSFFISISARYLIPLWSPSLSAKALNLKASLK